MAIQQHVLRLEVSVDDAWVQVREARDDVMRYLETKGVGVRREGR